MDETTASNVRAAMREAADAYLDTAMEDGKLDALYTLAAGFRDLDTGTTLTEDGRRAFTDDLGEDEPVWTLTRSHLEEMAGRPLTDEEVARFGKAMEYSSIADVIYGVLDSCGLHGPDENE